MNVISVLLAISIGAQPPFQVMPMPSAATKQPVEFKLYTPEPVQFKIVDEAPPVEFKLFTPERVRPPKAPTREVDPEREKQKANVPPPIDEATAHLPVVRLYIATDGSCLPCNMRKKEYLTAVADAKAKKKPHPFPFVIEFYPPPSWVDTLPTFHFQDENGIWRKATGANLAEFVRVWYGYHPSLTPPKQMYSTPQPQRHAMTSRDILQTMPQPYRHWNLYPGRIQDHLRQEHGWSLPLDGLSVWEMERIHSALHEGLIQPNGGRTSSQVRQTYVPQQQMVYLDHRGRPYRGRGPPGPHVRKMDPFTIISLISLAWKVGTFFCNRCNQ